jgi:arginyl-tRNA synthetase
MNYIARTIDITLQELFPGQEIPKTRLAIPPKWTRWDYSINIGTLGTIVKESPNSISPRIQEALREFPQTFTLIEGMKMYINLCLHDKAFIALLQESIMENYSREKQEWSVIVDYIGVNIGKPLHIGHICTPSIGQVFCNIYRNQWYTVVGDVHTWDWWGIFGRLIAGWKRWWDEAEFNRNPVNHLLKLYQKISTEVEPSEWEKDDILDQECRDEFKKLSEWDPENMRLWSRFTKESLENMQRTIDLLHVHPDVAIGESFYEGLPLPKIGEYPDLTYTMWDVVNELVNKNIAQKNEDWSVSITFPEWSKLPSNIVQKQDGTHWYFASDLACIKYRVTNWWNPKKVIYCTDIRQQLHFQQVFAAARLAGWISEDVELIHAPNGFITLPEWAMSTRKWTIIKLDELVDEAFARTESILESKWRTWEKSLSKDDVREIAVWAIKYSYLMQDREKNVIFDWDKALNFEGNSGPYIQYAFVRWKKILEWMSKEKKAIIASDKYTLTEHDKRLIQVLIRSDEAISEVLIKHKPHVLASYVYELASTFNSFYAHTPNIVNEANPDLKELRLHLVSIFTERLEEAWNLLWMKMPSEM